MGDMDLKLRAEQLRSLSGTARSRAREELAAAGEDAVSVLVPLLTDADKQVRWEAAKALVSICSSAAAPALVPLLEDQDAGVRWLAAEALVAAGIGVAPPFCVPSSTDPGPTISVGEHFMCFGS